MAGPSAFAGARTGVVPRRGSEGTGPGLAAADGSADPASLLAERLTHLGVVHVCASGYFCSLVGIQRSETAAVAGSHGGRPVDARRKRGGGGGNRAGKWPLDKSGGRRRGGKCPLDESGAAWPVGKCPLDGSGAAGHGEGPGSAVRNPALRPIRPRGSGRDDLELERRRNLGVQTDGRLVGA